MKTFVNSGIMIGSQRFFENDGTFLNITNIKTGLDYWNYLHIGEAKYYLFGCHETTEGNRCFITKDTFENPKSCIAVDTDFYVNCYNITDFKSIYLNGCFINFDFGKNEFDDIPLTLRLLNAD